MLFTLDFIFMVPSILVLGTQILDIKMRSSKLIVKSTTQKVVIKYGFGHGYCDLKILKLDFLSYSLHSL